MTVEHINALVKGLAPAIRDYVLSATKSLSDRLERLETQESIAGPKGDPGPQGEKGADGRDGRNGVDGISLGIEHLSETAEFDPETRTAVFRFSNGTTTKDVRLKLAGTLVDRGVFSSEKDYDAGDVVSYGGSMWVAQYATKGAQPGLRTDASRAWRLSVKAGRDGREGKEGKPGKDGRDGRDFDPDKAIGRPWR